jgi:capsid assembly protease
LKELKINKALLTRGHVHLVEPCCWEQYAGSSFSVDLDDSEKTEEELFDDVSDTAIALMAVSGACYYKTGVKKEWLKYAYAIEWTHVLDELSELVANPKIASIIIDMDSPGGAVFGTPEAAEKMAELSAKKKIIVYANPGIFSAAYWVASQASEIYMLPSGYVGSIGTLIMHQDYSGMYTKMGIETTVIKYPERKAETNSYEALTSGAKKRLQDDAERIYKSFVDSVAKGRKVSSDFVMKNFGQGGILNAEQALFVGAVDGVMTFDELVSLEISKTSTNNSKNFQSVNNLNKIKLELEL